MSGLQSRKAAIYRTMMGSTPAVGLSAGDAWTEASKNAGSPGGSLSLHVCPCPSDASPVLHAASLCAHGPCQAAPQWAVGGKPSRLPSKPEAQCCAAGYALCGASPALRPPPFPFQSIFLLRRSLGGSRWWPSSWAPASYASHPDFEFRASAFSPVQPALALATIWQSEPVGERSISLSLPDFQSFPP